MSVIRLWVTLMILSVAFFGGCSKKTSQAKGQSSGGFLDDNPDNPLPTPPVQGQTLSILTGGRQQYPSQVSFTGTNRKPFPGTDGNYVIGMGFTNQTGNIARFELFGRQIYADGSFGPLVKFVNGSNKSDNYTPPGGWDFSWYAGATSARVITGISVSSEVTHVSVITRSIGPRPVVGDAVNFSLPSGNPYNNVQYFTVPDYSYPARNTASGGASRAFFALVGINIEGTGLEMGKFEVHHHQFYAQWGPTTGQLEFQLKDPQTDTLYPKNGQLGLLVIP